MSVKRTLWERRELTLNRAHKWSQDVNCSTMVQANFTSGHWLIELFSRWHRRADGSRDENANDRHLWVRDWIWAYNFQINFYLFFMNGSNTHLCKLFRKNTTVYTLTLTLGQTHFYKVWWCLLTVQNRPERVYILKFQWISVHLPPLHCEKLNLWLTGSSK